VGVRLAEAIFHGLVSEESGGNGSARILTFDVTRVWKGEAAETTDLRTGSGGGDCGLEFQEGDETMVFAYLDEDGVLASNICSSRGATRTTVEALLGPGAEPSPGTQSSSPWLGLAMLRALLAWFGLDA
jgi:hypothetical protein